MDGTIRWSKQIPNEKSGGVWVGCGIDKINVESSLYGSDAWVLVSKVDVPSQHQHKVLSSKKNVEQEENVHKILANKRLINFVQFITTSKEPSTCSIISHDVQLYLL
jgi:hypothetical protein